MTKARIRTDKAPNPVGPYSQAVVAGGLLFASGQIPIDPGTNVLISGTIEVETERVMQNLAAVLVEAQLGWGNVVKTTVYLTDLEDFAAMNAVYSRYLDGEAPARSTVQVAALPKGARVEIDLVAAF